MKLECPARTRGASGCGRCKYTGGSTSALCISMQKVYQFRQKQKRPGPEAFLSQPISTDQPEPEIIDN